MKHQPIIILSLTLALLIGTDYLSAWNAPAAIPPTSNVAAPLNAGDASQIKIGGLGVGALDVAGGAIVRGTTDAGDLDFTVTGRVGAFEYCDVNGQNCSGPLPTCTSGQTLVADAAGMWVCGAPAAVAPTTIWLVNNQHSESQCTSLGGTVVADTGGNRFCRFNAPSCPSGWAQYQNWSERAGYTTGNVCPALTFGRTCTFTGIPWSNSVKSETRSVQCDGTGDNDNRTVSCSARLSQIGCY